MKRKRIELLSRHDRVAITEEEGEIKINEREREKKTKTKRNEGRQRLKLFWPFFYSLCIIIRPLSHRLSKLLFSYLDEPCIKQWVNGELDPGELDPAR